MPFLKRRGWVRKFDSYCLSGGKPKKAKLTMSFEVGLTEPIFKLYPIICAKFNVRACVGVPKNFGGIGG
jgi:hypothetical protein